MKNKFNNISNQTLAVREKTVKCCSGAAVILVGLLFAVISVYSVLQTCRFPRDNPASETILFQNDSVITNLGLLAMTILGLLVLIRKNVHISKVNTGLILFIMIVFITVLPIIWVDTAKSVSSGETATMLDTARQAVNGNYSHFTTPYAGDYSYYQYYPFQLGYVFFAQIMFAVFGTDQADTLLQFPNVIALVFAYVGLVMITKKLFERKSVTNMTAIALMACFQPMFMTTLTNGVLIGLALSIWAIFFTLRFMKEDKLLFGGLAVLLITLAAVIKYTYMVVLIAIVIALVLHFIDKLKLISLALIALMILCPVGLQMLLEQSYASSSETTLGSRVTNTLYELVGVTEQEDSKLYAGWFSYEGVSILREAKMDRDEANLKAKEQINERRKALNSQGRLWEFYGSKLLSQINEPSFQSIWVSQVRQHDYPDPTPENPEVFPKFAKSIYTGGLSRIIDRWFNYYNMIIFFGFAAGMVWIIVRKKLSPGMIILPTSVFGGLLYHTFCEAKSQFMLPFFVMLIPFAVYGILNSIRALNNISSVLFKENHPVGAEFITNEKAASKN